MAMIPITTMVKLFFTNELLANKYPAKQKAFTQRMFPTKLKEKNRIYFIVPTPATKGANVLKIGIKRAIIIVLPPCFS